MQSTIEADIGQLLSLARQNGSAGLGTLWQRMTPFVTLIAEFHVGKMLKGKVEVSDLVQETLMRATQAFERFRGETEAELAAWLRTIAKHVVLDCDRRFHGTAARKLSREQSLDDMLDGSFASFMGELAAHQPSPSQSAARREMSVVISDAISQLPTDYRQVLLLRSFQELDWPEIATSMNRTVGSVRMLWRRALIELRPIMERC